EYYCWLQYSGGHWVF
nr:immunoglobulin light chain junction region [Macaca mulatta]MOX80658.1 immunoglobulin light chain junction region [Macaca mulatta]